MNEETAFVNNALKYYLKLVRHYTLLIRKKQLQLGFDIY